MITDKKLKIRKFILLSLLFLLIFNFYPDIIGADFSYPQNLKIHFLDVGEGESTLIETPRGRTVLVDSGNFITGFKVANYLKDRKINSLDYLILTHPHLDHIGGVFFIIQMLKVDKVYDNGQDLTSLIKSSDLYRWYQQLVRKDNNYAILKAGDTFELDGVKFATIWPPQPSIFSGLNANSLVIMLDYKDFRCLLTADINTDVEAVLLKRKIDLRANILKVAHHGSINSNSLEFLKAVSPAISIISINKDNIRGYPSPLVIERFKSIRSRVYYTYKSGNILISVENNNKITIIEELP